MTGPQDVAREVVMLQRLTPPLQRMFAAERRFSVGLGSGTADPYVDGRVAWCAQDIDPMNHLCASCRGQKASKVNGLAAQHGYRAVLC